MTREDEVFGDALVLPPGERVAFVDRVCQDEPAVRLRVHELLAAHDEGVNFLAEPLMPRVKSDTVSLMGRQLGRYRLLEKIGEGGCGVVWMADQQEPMRRRVAVKVIKLGMDTKEVIARFEAERQALAMMDHPNIARVLDAGTSDRGRPYFVMDLVRGVPITQYCDEHQLTAAQRIELFIEVCHAVQHAHQKGIIHRDLKPSNILVTRNDGVAVPKVIDFGIAKATQGRLTDQTVFTAFHQFIGTPVYMSPEQAELSSVDVDTRSDIYSLGVLLYELLAGEPPFDRRSLSEAGVDEIRRRIRLQEPPRPSSRYRTLADPTRTTVARQRGTLPGELASLLRGDLDWIVMRCLEKDRARRYETANGLAMDLRRYLADEPVVARPPSAWYAAGKLVRRHRVLFGAGGAVGLALLAGVIVSTWLAVRATQAEDAQAALRREAERASENQAKLRRHAEAHELLARRQAYAADIYLVQQALAADMLSTALELLDRHRPRPGEIDLRGWEWRYLWQFCRSEATAVLAEKASGIFSLAASDDGAWIAYGETDEGRYWLRHVASGRETGFHAGTEAVRVAFSPQPSVLGVLFNEGGLRLRILNYSTGQTLSEWPLETANCLGFCFSSDGAQVATAVQREGAGCIEIWRTADGAKLASHRVEAPAVTIDSNRFAVAPDFSVAARVGGVKQLLLIDLRTGVHRRIENAVEERIWALAFSPDGKTLATNGSTVNPAIRLWDVASAREIGRLEGHSRVVRKLEFSRDGVTLISAGDDQSIRLWDVAERRLLRTLRGHRASISALAWLRDGSTIVSGCDDGAICAWDAAPEPRRTPTFHAPNADGAGAVNWRVDDEAVWVADGGGRLERWGGRQFSTRELLRDFGAQARITLARDSPLAAVQAGTTVELWNWERRAPAGTFSVDAAEVRLGAILAQGRRVLLLAREAGTSGWQLQEWDVAGGRRLREWPVRRELPAGHVFVSPDERYGVLASGRVGARVIEGGNLVPADVIELVPGTLSEGRLDLVLGARVEFSPDSVALPVLRKRRIALLGLPALEEVRAVPRDMELRSEAVAFSADGTRLIVGSHGAEAITLWDVHGGGRVLTLGAPASSFQQVAQSAGGRTIAGRTADGVLYLWQAPTWEEIAAAEKR